MNSFNYATRRRVTSDVACIDTEGPNISAHLIFGIHIHHPTELPVMKFGFSKHFNGPD